jgi:hypothetical protein
MLGKSTPILSGAIPSFELFMTSWEQLASMHARLTAWIDVGMQFTTEYYKCMDHTHSYIVAMGESFAFRILISALMAVLVFNPTICMSWI